ncbi:Protein pim1 [Neolecta irregularis DAH-3]|uniref:Protein pim1 n=1 Tax=Neolecta irregularis (strain DAH-3) TaxID=1198029 RepID=A0A1U7LJX4_NEOID|nr:Protein pim1 [Neolecta irregularis DAH-3]|eukprot:OLL22852.1 Protein pim1 [Neolecta irregularis DAH-3]
MSQKRTCRSRTTTNETLSSQKSTSSSKSTASKTKTSSKKTITKKVSPHNKPPPSQMESEIPAASSKKRQISGDKQVPSSKRSKTAHHPSPSQDDPSAKIPPAKRGRTATTAAKRTTKPPLNPPRIRLSEKLAVYVFGTGTMAELGLGPASNCQIVKRPRLNTFLDLEKVGAVDISVGGMHSAALAFDGKIYTWGVNDQGALGRDTRWEVPPPKATVNGDADADDSEEDENEPINPRESVPGVVVELPQDVNVVSVACGDSITAAITDEGELYTWGTFRCSEGLLGYSPHYAIMHYPALIHGLHHVVQVVCGTDHILALTAHGKVFAWGNGQQCQLGRKVVERTRNNALTPREFGLKNIKVIGTGSYHSFAIDNTGTVFSWGLNQFGQCGLANQGNQNEAVIGNPTRVHSLKGYDVVGITGGEHHSIAVTRSGDVLAWGRLDGCQLGLCKSDLPPEKVYKDDGGRPRYIYSPTKVPGIPPVEKVFCGTHHNVAITKDGAAWSWGFGEMYQVGHGPPGEDITVPTQIVNTATTGVHMVNGGAGSQFTVLLGRLAQTNGH